MFRLPVRKGERLVTALMFAYIFGALSFYYILKPLRSGLFLKTTTESGEGFISALPRGELIGRPATAHTDLRPSGTALVDGERLDVVTEGEYIKAGTALTIIRSDGYRHVVRAAS
jgi:membrane-bound serine protease (ClpP class)